MADPKAAGTFAGSGSFVGAAALGAALVAGAVVLGVVLRDDPGAGATDAPGVASAHVAEPALETAATDAGIGMGMGTASSALSPQVVPAAPLVGVDPQPAEDETPGTVPPDTQGALSASDTLRFDLVRIDPDGNAVIAGRAPPLAEVTLSLDGSPVEVVTADAGGQFVALLSLGPSELPRLLSLLAALPGDGAGAAPMTVEGAETVIVAPVGGGGSLALAPEIMLDPVPAETATAAIDASAMGDVDATAPLPADEAAGDAPTAIAAAPPATLPGATAQPDAAARVPDIANVDAPPVQRPQAPAVLLADGDGIRVLQPPTASVDTSAAASPEAVTDLRLDVISYDPDGVVTLAGRGPDAASVRVVLDDLAVATAAIAPDGQWQLVLPAVDPGTYTLRLDTVGADGTVTRGQNTPFLREDPARIRANAMAAAPGASVITVQPGFTLWGIAEANFGSGVLYVQVFAENRDAIRDPDLIFPGQIFALPDLPRAIDSSTD